MSEGLRDLLCDLLFWLATYEDMEHWVAPLIELFECEEENGMALGDYRAHVTGAESAANGDVHLDVFIQRQTDEGPPAVWVDIPKGHRTLVLDGQAVLAITENEALTTQEKVQQLLDLFMAEIGQWGTDQSDKATTAIDDLVSNWPVNVALPTS